MAKLPNEVLTVRVPPQLKKQLKRLAGEDQRTLSNLVEVLLSHAIPQYVTKAAQSKDGTAA